MANRWQQFVWPALFVGLVWGVAACDSGGGGEGSEGGNAESGAESEEGAPGEGTSDEGEGGASGEESGEPGEAGESDEGSADEGAGPGEEGTPEEEGTPGEEGQPEDEGGGGPIVVEPIDGVPAPGAMCPYEAPFGTFTGDHLKDMTFTTCAGETLTLWDVSCGAAATWFFFTTTWCPYCKDTVAAMPDIIDEFYSQGVRFALVMWENDFGQPPTPADCSAYTKKFKLPADRILIGFDPTQQKSLQFYEPEPDGSFAVSLSVVTNRRGEIVEKNPTTTAGAVAWRLRYELEKMAEEEGLQP